MIQGVANALLKVASGASHGQAAVTISVALITRTMFEKHDSHSLISRSGLLLVRVSGLAERREENTLLQSTIDQNFTRWCVSFDAGLRVNA